MAQLRPSSAEPYRWWRLMYGPTLLLHRCPTPAGAQHHRRRPSFPWGTKSRGIQQPRGNKLQGITSGQTELQGEQQQRLRRTKQRLKRKQQEQISWNTKVKTQTKTTLNLQGCGRNEDVNINDNRRTSTRNRTRDHMCEEAAP